MLAPLGLEDVGRLIADTLHCAPERVAPLAALVHEKTAGNPFFTIQFLTALAEEGLLAVDPGQGRWSWDLERIRAKGYTDNVVDLMLGKLRRLPAATQDALQLLACLGNSAAISTLALVRGGGEAALDAAFWEAVRAGLVLRLEGSYRFPARPRPGGGLCADPRERAAAEHLRIGRLLAAHTPPEAIEESVFEIVSQLNRGAALITAAEEREQVAELNLIAGQRAKASTAYAAALTYLVAGAALLAEDGWERRHELSLRARAGPGRMRVPDRRLAAADAAAGDALEPRRNHGGPRHRRLPARGSVHDPRIRATAPSRSASTISGMSASTGRRTRQKRRCGGIRAIWRQLGSRPIEALLDLP